jgi:hypothetical protein
MKTKQDKEIDNIRKRKSYKEMASFLRFVIDNPEKPIDILKMTFPVYSYGVTPRKPKWANPESLNQVIKDYEDAKRQTETTTRGLGNPVPFL